ncbi:MAG: alpha/beta hydrolase [Cyanobacteria bacterium SID2]|nr:alpha/beta hydrolase [Cyanobacteria bacterium SID2]MBP0006149.1 alpha/beta hydrolase [Cyanobacteria bacterium SBC]
MSTLEIGWQHHYIETNRIRLHCVTQGEGQLVVLLHGFPEFWYSWRYQIPALARHFKVIVPDLRGYNDSDKPRSGYDLDTLSADVRGLVSALGYRHAHIVGHDWGGAIAWNLAQTFPEIVDRLAILNAPHPQQFVRGLTGNLDRLRRSWYVFAFQIPSLPEWVIQHNLKDFVQNIFRESAIRKSAFSREAMQIYEAALEKPGVLTSILQYYRQLLAPQTWLKNWLRVPEPISAPTLVLWGEDDSFLSKTLTEGLEKLIAAPFQLKFISQCGHWIQQEVPQTVNRELLDFFKV